MKEGLGVALCCKRQLLNKLCRAAKGEADVSLGFYFNGSIWQRDLVPRDLLRSTGTPEGFCHRSSHACHCRAQSRQKRRIVLISDAQRHWLIDAHAATFIASVKRASGTAPNQREKQTNRGFRLQLLIAQTIARLAPSVTQQTRRLRDIRRLRSQRRSPCVVSLRARDWARFGDA